MSDQVDHVWVQAVDQYLKTLTREDLNKIRSINGEQGFLELSKRLKERYTSQEVTRALNRINPFLTKLHSFSEVIRTFTNANPEIASLVWGSVFFVLELACRHARNLERIVTAFELCDRHTARFHFYITKFSSQDPSQRLQKALVGYYAELIGVLQEAIRFLQKPPIVNFLIGPFRSLDEKLHTRICQLRELIAEVDQEALVTSASLQEIRQTTQHQEVLQQFDIRTKYLGRELGIFNTNMYLGTLPAHNLPFVQNPTFFGRHDQLQSLEAMLMPGTQPEQLRAFALHGLGGAGKTQVALEYAYRNLHQYPAVFWVQAETALKLSDSFARLPQLIGLVGSGVQNPAQLRDIFIRWLASSGKRGDPHRSVSWLLIFDNVNDWKTLEPYWPKSANGSIVVTTRNPEIARRVSQAPSTLQLCSFEESEGCQFLLRLTNDRNAIDLGKDELIAASKISHALGHLPLALDLVGSYVASAGITLTRFYETTRGLERDFIFDDEAYHWNVKTYESSIKNIWTPTNGNNKSRRGLSQSSRLLMDMLAFLDPDGVPETLFSPKRRELLLYEGPDIFDPKVEEYTKPPFSGLASMDRSIAELLQGSYISRTRIDNRLVCHRVVQKAFLINMSAERRSSIFHRLVFLLNAEFPQQPDGESLWPKRKQCEEYHPQVSALLESYDRIQGDLGHPLKLAEIVTRCSWFLFERGHYRESSAMIDTAMKICQEASASKNHPGYSSFYISELLGHLYSIRGSLECGIGLPGHGVEWKEKCRAIRAQIVRPNYPDDRRWISVADGNIVVSLMAEGRCDEALSLSERLLQQKDSETHRHTQMANKCICLILLHRYDEASTTCVQTMDLTKERCGVNSPEMAVLHHYLGVLHHHQRNLDDSFFSFAECLRIRLQIMPDHHFTGYVTYKLGVVTREKGDPESSISFLREALRIANNSIFPDVGQRCRAAFALVELLNETGDTEAASSLKAEAIELRSQLPLIDGCAALSDNPKDYDRFISFSHR